MKIEKNLFCKKDFLTKTHINKINMKQYYSILMKLYPSKEQQQLIDKNIGCCRFLYNQMLNERKTIYEKYKKDKNTLYGYKYKTEKQYKEEYPFLKEADSTALKKTKLALDNAYNNFFKSLSGRRKGGNISYPAFKKKKDCCTYSTANPQIININYIKLPKLGKIKCSCNFKTIRYNKICFATIKNKNGNYFCSITLEREVETKNPIKINENSKVVGLDMSLPKFFVDSDGNSPKYEKFYKKYENKINILQHLESKKTKNSRKYNKLRKSINKKFEKISNKRKDFSHKLSTKLVKENDMIVVESLTIRDLSQLLNFGKSIMDLGYSEFIRQLKYKCEWYGKHLIEADKWFASSKICSKCGYKYNDLALKDRKWVCPKCGSVIDRDVNAAINLKNLGVGHIHKCLQSQVNRPAMK